MNKRVSRIIFTILILGSFLLANYNVFFNGHYHRLLNGNLIFHAHPYDKQSQNSGALPAHSHSQIQLLSYFELLTSLAFTLIYTIVISYFNDALLDIYKIIKRSWFQILFIIRFHFRRGPPVFSLH